MIHFFAEIKGGQQGQGSAAAHADKTRAARSSPRVGAIYFFPYSPTDLFNRASIFTCALCVPATGRAPESHAAVVASFYFLVACASCPLFFFGPQAPFTLDGRRAELDVSTSTSAHSPSTLDVYFPSGLSSQIAALRV